MGIVHSLSFDLLLFVLFHTVSGVSFPSISDALVSLRSEIRDDSHSLAEWVIPLESNSSDKIDACHWSGVSCNENFTAVTGLDLAGRNLSGVLTGNQLHPTLFSTLLHLNLSDNYFYGQLPPGIFNLTNLKTLDISSNFFSGNFPNGISKLIKLVSFDSFSNNFSGPLSSEFSHLQSLEVLNLAGSYFTGEIPSEYGSLKSIKYIHLAGNLLSGRIPSELGMLKTLTHMEIGYNSYEGGLPWQLGNLSNLQYLDISGSNLSASIPVTITDLTNLQSLYLFRNHITGSIPWQIGKMSSLENLDVSDNRISGKIPDSLAELKRLRLLSLMCNKITGSFPEGITKLPMLESLFTWNNMLTGRLPQNLGAHSNLRIVDISTNRFSGNIPPSICKRNSLLRLILFSNKITGSIPESLNDCSSLVRLRIEDNSISGEIPLNFTLLPNITYVDLSTNNLTGGIPSDLPRASSLKYFNVSMNPNLGGRIPERIFTSLPLLQNFSASSCDIYGDIPVFSNCGSLSTLELGTNRLSGGIPRSISNCGRLENVILSRNGLSGSLPPELAGLGSLVLADLSHNRFDGRIPEEFGSSASLLLLNVSYNDITGSIPKNFRGMDPSAFAGNPDLCGSPCFAENANGMRKLVWVVALCSGLFVSAVFLVVGIVYRERRDAAVGWKMVSFEGLPEFKVSDVMRGVHPPARSEGYPSSSKAVLPTGMTVLLRKVERGGREERMDGFVTRFGSVRHENLVRLLGFCYSSDLGYLVYDQLPYPDLSETIRVRRDWASKHKIIVGIARGLCHLHHGCRPPIPHGDLKPSTVLCDSSNMKPFLIDYGLKSIARRVMTVDEVREGMEADVYSFGEVVLEIMANGRLRDFVTSVDWREKGDLLAKIHSENYKDSSVPSSSCSSYSSSPSTIDGVNRAFEVAVLCMACRPCDRPSMEDAENLLLTRSG